MSFHCAQASIFESAITSGGWSLGGCARKEQAQVVAGLGGELALVVEELETVHAGSPHWRRRAFFEYNRGKGGKIYDTNDL